MPLYSLLILELTSGILLALSVPNELLQYGSFILGMIALIPHFVALEKSKNLKQAVILCFIQSLTAHLLSSYWLTFSKEFALFTLGASALGTAVLHSFFAPLFRLPSYIKSFSNSDNSPVIEFLHSNTFKAIWLASVYTVWEFVKSSGYLAYPWGTIPMCAYSQKLITQIADITGVRGVTFLISYFASSMTFLLLDYLKYSAKEIFGRNKATFSSVLLLFTLSTVYGLFQYTIKRTPIKHINAILIQQNYDPWKQPDDDQTIYDSQRLTLKGVEELQNEGKKPDLVVWSEGVLHYPFPQGSDVHYRFYPELNPLLPFLAQINAPTIIGAPYCHNFEERKFSNAAIIFNSNGEYKDYYAKMHLVPFAEHIPFSENAVLRSVLQKIVGFVVGWVPGKEFKTFEIPLSDYPGESAVISTPLCFEDAFGNIFAGLKKNGTEVFVNMTDDSWSQKKSAEYQHFVIAWYRAIEFRTTLVRSTNSGCTIVEDPSGHVIYSLPLFVQDELSCSIPIYRNFLTFYAIFGEWFCFLLICFICLTAIYLFLYR